MIEPEQSGKNRNSAQFLDITSNGTAIAWDVAEVPRQVQLMNYSVKEIYYTLQGEGANAGRPAVLCRFAGCNLWTGLEQDRKNAICQFCDTDFVGTDGINGGKYVSARDLATKIASLWPTENAEGSKPFVICTGGEPLLQMDEPLVNALHSLGFEIAIETNGTRVPPPGIDWICVSPKANSKCLLRSGDELKLIYPQAGAEPELFEGFSFQHFFLQPMDGPNLERNTKLAVEYCLKHPRWRLSLQTHKIVGIR